MPPRQPPHHGKFPWRQYLDPGAGRFFPLSKNSPAESRQEVERLKGYFQQWSRKNGFNQAVDLLDWDWERMGTFYNYPKKQWQHLRTTNPVESPFSGLWLRTDAARAAGK